MGKLHPQFETLDLFSTRPSKWWCKDRSLPSRQKTAQVFSEESGQPKKKRLKYMSEVAPMEWPSSIIRYSSSPAASSSCKHGASIPPVWGPWTQPRIARHLKKATHVTGRSHNKPIGKYASWRKQRKRIRVEKYPPRKRTSYHTGKECYQKEVFRKQHRVPSN